MTEKEEVKRTMTLDIMDFISLFQSLDDSDKDKVILKMRDFLGNPSAQTSDRP